VPWSPLPTPDARGEPDPGRLPDLLDAVMAGLGGPSASAIVAIHERWDELVGVEVAPHAKPLGIDGGRLRIGVDGPAWASHLRWSEAEILARVHALVGPDEVTSVVVRVVRP
jgi:predicted nucleic acid-binding Zn ribbon protein